MISRGGYGEKEGPKYGGPISFIMINVRDAVYCTCTDPGPCGLEIWGPAARSLAGTPTLAASRLDPQVQDPLPKCQKFSYTLYIYRKFTRSLTTETKLANWQNEG